MLDYEKAIVSSVEGTTRDVVEGSLQINGVKFDFYDTAGIRETADNLERLGIERSEKILKTADVVLLVLDGSKELSKEDEKIIESVKDKELITVYNKSDLKGIDGVFNISAKTGAGIDKLKEEIYSKAFKNGIDLNGEYITEERHFLSLKNAKQSLIEALNNIGIVPLDLVAEDIKNVGSYLGEITGKTASEEIIDEIFKKFCVGK